MKLIVASFAVVLAALAAECPPKPSPAPLGDAAPPPAPLGDASAESLAACANLADAGCEDGLRANCGVTIDHARATRVRPVDMACLTKSHDRAALKRCGAECP
jgi:hypothetical protein